MLQRETEVQGGGVTTAERVLADSTGSLMPVSGLFRLYPLPCPCWVPKAKQASCPGHEGDTRKLGGSAQKLPTQGVSAQEDA